MLASTLASREETDVGMWDRLKGRLGLSPDDEEYDDDEYYEDGEPAEEPPAYTSPYGAGGGVRRLDREPDLDRARSAAPNLHAVPSVDRAPAAAPASQVNMHIAKPKSYGEAQAIGDKFKAGTPVIMDLSTTESDLSKRLIDFASGLTYGLSGGLQKVSDRVFLLTPPNVTVSAEDRKRLKDTGLFTYDG